jgi:hypothetical protein
VELSLLLEVELSLLLGLELESESELVLAPLLELEPVLVLALVPLLELALEWELESKPLSLAHSTYSGQHSRRAHHRTRIPRL